MTQPQMELKEMRREAQQQTSLGELMLDIDQAAAARQHYGRALELWRQIVDQTNTPADREELACVYIGLGDAAVCLSDPGEAERCYSDSLAISLELAQADPTQDNWYSVAAVSQRLGDAAVCLGDLAAAKKNYERDLELSRRFVQECPQNAEHRKELVVTLQRLAGVLQAEDDTAAARQLFAEAYDVALALFVEEPDPDNRGSLADSAVYMGSLAAGGGEYDAARPYFAQACDLWQAVVREADSRPARHSLVKALRKLGDLELTEGNVAAADECHTRADALEAREQ